LNTGALTMNHCKEMAIAHKFRDRPGEPLPAFRGMSGYPCNFKDEPHV
jgi:hypothetical protein